MAVLLACATLISTGLGGVIAMRFRDRLHLLLGFGAGAVMGVVFFDVLPEVFSLEIRPPSVMLGCAAGFLAFFTLERMTALHGAREHEHVNTAHQAELGLLRVRSVKSHTRPALGAGDAFGVESAVMRLAVLGPARVAALKMGHRGPLAVVRQRADDRKPGATGRTRLQGISVSPIVGID